MKGLEFFAKDLMRALLRALYILSMSIRAFVALGSNAYLARQLASCLLDSNLARRCVFENES
jgi:hypothetical protein